MYAWLAGVVVILHLGFILFVATGALLSWRWGMLLWLHVPAVLYVVANLTGNVECPLTHLENRLRILAGGQMYSGGFVQRYLSDVVYPGGWTRYLQALAAICIIVGYARLVVCWRAARRRQHQPDLTAASSVRVGDAQLGRARAPMDLPSSGTANADAPASVRRSRDRV
jgi:Protein of Unknown function (DUF2784)